MSDFDYYEILGISKDADENQIKKAYRKMARKWHPDRNPDEAEKSGEMFKKIGESYEVLSDPNKRKIYDMHGKKGLEENGFDFDSSNLTEVLKEMFGMGSGMGQGMPGMPPGMFSGIGQGMPGMPPGMFSGMGEMHSGMGVDPRQEREMKKQKHVLVAECELTLEQIYSGKTITNDAKRNIYCESCDGTGSQDKKKKKCSECNGQGRVVKMRKIGPGFMQQQILPCEKCEATGECVDKLNKCKKCNGSGHTKERFSYTFVIPPGFDEDKIIIEDEGNEYEQYVRGDIIVVIKVSDHDVFERNVNPMIHISMKVELSLVDILCGFTKKFKFLDSKEYSIQSDETTMLNKMKIIKGKGMPYGDGEYGDLVVRFMLKKEKIPKLTKEQKTAIRDSFGGEPKEDIDSDTVLELEEMPHATSSRHEASPECCIM
jgi:DnaJ homolog subfamily A member 2